MNQQSLQASTSAPVVVITGASAGIGRATAREFASRGARVALLARGREGLEAAAREVEAAGGEALVLPVDVSDAAEVEAAAAAVEERWGGIDTTCTSPCRATMGRTGASMPGPGRPAGNPCSTGTAGCSPWGRPWPPASG